MLYGFFPFSESFQSFKMLFCGRLWIFNLRLKKLCKIIFISTILPFGAIFPADIRQFFDEFPIFFTNSFQWWVANVTRQNVMLAIAHLILNKQSYNQHFPAKKESSFANFSDKKFDHFCFTRTRIFWNNKLGAFDKVSLKKIPFKKQHIVLK